jgi:hypothetical protein
MRRYIKLWVSIAFYGASTTPEWRFHATANDAYNWVKQSGEKYSAAWFSMWFPISNKSHVLQMMNLEIENYFQQCEFVNPSGKRTSQEFGAQSMDYGT